MMHRTLLASTIMLAFSPLAFAEQTTDIPTITVVGQTLESPVASVTTEFGSRYHFVTDKTIEQQNSVDFNSAIRNVPGVMTSTTTMLGGQTGASLFIRGRGASHPSPDLQVQFDGVPRMGALYGQTMADGIAVNTIGGIEIFKSPSPDVFGSGYAMVNIEPKRMTENGTIGQIELAGGTHQTFSEQISTGHKSGPVDIFVAQSWYSTDGHRDHSRANQGNYYANMGLVLSEHWEARLVANYVDSQTLMPKNNSTGQFGTSGTRFDTKTTFSTLSLNNRYDNAQGYLKAYWNDTQFDMLHENIGQAKESNSQQKIKMYGLRAREDFQFIEGNQIRMGFDLDRQVLDNYQNFINGNPSKHWDFPEITLFSPYIAMSQFIGNEQGWHMKPSAGLRFYDNNEFGDKWAPHAGVTVGYQDTELSLNYARGVNYPSPVILQGGILNQHETFWDDVKPEVVDHYELTLSQRVGDVANASVSVFYDEGKDRFRAYMFGGIPETFNDPIGRYKIKGIELSGNWQPTDRLALFGSVTYMDAEATSKDKKATHLPYTPEWMVKAGVDWSVTDKTHAYLDVQHMSDLYGGNSGRGGGYFVSDSTTKLKDITLVNVRVSRTFNYSPLHVADSEVFVAVNNLFNHKYSYIDGYPMAGITAMIGTKINFK